MSAFVIIFFVGSAAGTLLVGLQFARTNQEALKYFGGGLMAAGIAFAFWTVARIINPDDPDDLRLWVTLGVLFLLIAILAFLYSWASKLEERRRNMVLLGGLVYVAVLIALRFAYPSDPFISDDGLFFFNPHGSVAILEAGALAFSVLPATLLAAGQLRSMEATVLQVCITTLVIGGIILITSLDDVTVTLDGWMMGAALAVMLFTFVVRQPSEWLADGSKEGV
jgi:hypothetical protein